MSSQHSPRARRWVIGYAPLMLVAIFTTACATLNPETVTLPPPGDIQVATRIKARLIEDDSLAAAAIRVSSQASVVTLDGFVDNAGQKRRAQELAYGVAGVTYVANKLRAR